MGFASNGSFQFSPSNCLIDDLDCFLSLTSPRSTSTRLSTLTSTRPQPSGRTNFNITATNILKFVISSSEESRNDELEVFCNNITFYFDDYKQTADKLIKTIQDIGPYTSILSFNFNCTWVISGYSVHDSFI